MARKKMLKSLMTGGLIAALASGATAQAEDLFTKENIGRAIGAVTGAVIGAQIGHGGGRAAAVAIGTLGGYWIGGAIGRSLSQEDHAGIAHTTETALETGESQSWSNPETGVSTNVSVREDYAGSRKPRLEEAPPLDYINAYYTVNSNVNVRGGPGTDYEIVHGLSKGARVPVIGKVQGRDWYMIAEGGEGSGFVYAPLMTRADGAVTADNAIRDSMQTGEIPPTYAVSQQRCRIITQEVTVRGGERQSREFRACQQADGSWVEA